MYEVRWFTAHGYLVGDVVAVAEEIFEDFGDG